MKIKLKVKPLTEADKQATQEKIRNTVKRAIEAANIIQPPPRAKTPDGEAGTPLMIYVSEAMKAHIDQLAQLERRSVSSVGKELLEVALGLVVTPEEEAALLASDEIIQRGQTPRNDGDIAAATLERIRRNTNDPGVELPRPTTEDMNHGRFDPFTQTWNPKWDRANNKWRQ